MSGCSRTRFLGVHLRTTYGGMAQGHVGRYAFPYEFFDKLSPNG